MLTEPVECKSCNAVSVNGGTIHCHSCFKEAIRAGFVYALQQYGIWKDGERYIGCMGTNIKKVIDDFDKQKISETMAMGIMSEHCDWNTVKKQLSEQ